MGTVGSAGSVGSARSVGMVVETHPYHGAANTSLFAGIPSWMKCSRPCLTSWYGEFAWATHLPNTHTQLNTNREDKLKRER